MNRFYFVLLAVSMALVAQEVTKAPAPNLEQQIKDKDAAISQKDNAIAQLNAQLTASAKMTQGCFSSLVDAEYRAAKAK